MMNDEMKITNNKPQITNKVQKDNEQKTNQNQCESVKSVDERLYKINKSFGEAFSKASFLKIVFIFIAAVVAVITFQYPFPGPCYGCTIFQRAGFFLFKLFGLTAFLLPVLIILVLFFSKVEKVEKYLKLALYLWLPVLINLALVRDLLEVDVNLGGIASMIFSFARDHQIDYLLVLIPILAMDLLVLYLLGVNVPGMFKKIVVEIKRFFSNRAN
jgi:hypothetical protein